MQNDARSAASCPIPAPGTRRPRSALADSAQRDSSRAPASLAAWGGVLAVAAVLAVAVPAASADEAADLLEFHVMTPVTGPYVGTTNPIRGVNGGGLPWVIGHGRGHLEANGELEVRVRGLVLADDPAVPAALRLTNPVANFRATVSCLSIDTTGQPSTMNVETGPFPASARGDATIEATVPLPNPCIAPIVFVTSPSGAWFAATGN